MRIELDPFVNRQFTKEFTGTNLYGVDQSEFVEYINENGYLVDSQWDFCKYLILDNYFELPCSVIEIDLSIYPFIRTGYSSRVEGELPVLSRWVELPSGIKREEAKYIVCILYSKEQLESEFKSKSDGDFYFGDDVEWGVVAIQSTIEPNPDPIPPITMMRNSLGMEEGGNGVTLDKEQYKKSVDFWNKYILIK